MSKGGVRAECSSTTRPSDRYRSTPHQVGQDPRGVPGVDHRPGRIREDEVERPAPGEPPRRLRRVARHDLGPVLEAKRGHVGPEDRERLPRGFHQDRGRRAAREGLEPERPRAGVKVEDPRPLEPPRRGQDSEQGLAHAVGRGSGGLPLRRLERPRTQRTPGDPHDWWRRIHRVFAEGLAPALVCADGPCDRAGAHGAHRVPGALSIRTRFGRAPEREGHPRLRPVRLDERRRRSGRRADAGSAVTRAPVAGVVAGRDEPVVRDALSRAALPPYAQPVVPRSHRRPAPRRPLHMGHDGEGEGGRGQRRASPVGPRQASGRGERDVQREPEGPGRRSPPRPWPGASSGS